MESIIIKWIPKMISSGKQNPILRQPPVPKQGKCKITYSHFAYVISKLFTMKPPTQMTSNVLKI